MTRAPFVKTFGVTAVLVATFCATATSSEAAVRTRTTLNVSSLTPIVEETYTASGRVSTRFRRPVVLRVLNHRTWRSVRRVSTTTRGTYRFPRLSTARPTEYTVLVPRARHAGRLYTQVVSPVRSVSPVQQTGAVDVLPQVTQQGSTPAPASQARNFVVARFTPARPGRSVTIMRQLPNGSWQVAGTTSQGTDGTASYAGVARSGTWTYPFKATAAARSGARALTTRASSDTWGTAVFTDEFGGSALNQGDWSYREGVSSSRRLSTNDRRTVSVSGGTLRMQVMRDPAAPTTRFLNAQISTERSHLFRYGMMSSRIRFAKGRGQHGSFWLQSPTYNQYPGDPARSGAEIDAVEFFGQGYPRGGLASFLYYLDGSAKNVKIGDVWSRAAGLLPARDTWWDSYHVFSVRWTPQRYTFYVDGRQLFTTATGVSKTNEYLVLSLLTSDWEVPDLDRSTLPTTMSVDWTKVWQVDPGLVG